ncbi:hypothetical protein Tco_0559512 [Tanacetum coccineum]
MESHLETTQTVSALNLPILKQETMIYGALEWSNILLTLIIDSLKPRLSFIEADPKTNTIVTTPVNVTGAPVTNTVANHAEKLKKFNGQNFKRWQQKLFFYLGTLNHA